MSNLSYAGGVNGGRCARSMADEEGEILDPASEAGRVALGWIQVHAAKLAFELKQVASFKERSLPLVRTREARASYDAWLNKLLARVRCRQQALHDLAKKIGLEAKFPPPPNA